MSCLSSSAHNSKDLTKVERRDKPTDTVFGGYKYGMLLDPFDVALSASQRRTAGLPQRIRWSATRNRKPRVVCDICYRPLACETIADSRLQNSARGNAELA